jgi:hypothetical protein
MEWGKTGVKSGSGRRNNNVLQIDAEQCRVMQSTVSLVAVTIRVL